MKPMLMPGQNLLRVQTFELLIVLLITWGHKLQVNYSVHEYLVLTTGIKLYHKFMHNHVNQILKDTFMDSALLCHVWWDAVFCTYFIGIKCVDWNVCMNKGFVFWEIIISLIRCVWAEKWSIFQTHNIISNKTQNKWFCVFTSLPSCL